MGKRCFFWLTSEEVRKMCVCVCVWNWGELIQIMHCSFLCCEHDEFCHWSSWCSDNFGKHESLYRCFPMFSHSLPCFYHVFFLFLPCFPMFSNVLQGSFSVFSSSETFTSSSRRSRNGTTCLDRSRRRGVWLVTITGGGNGIIQWIRLDSKKYLKNPMIWLKSDHGW